MFRRATKQRGENTERRDTLSQLLATEDQMVTRLASAQLDADRILADAEDYARAVERSCAKTIADRIASIHTQTEQELEHEFAQIKADTIRETRLLDGVGDREVGALVALVLARLVATNVSPGEEHAA